MRQREPGFMPPPVVWLTALLVLFTLTHAAEDFQYREFESRFGVDGLWAAAALGMLVGCQSLGAYLAGRGERSGSLLLAAAALILCVGAIAVHWPEILAAGPYRHGLISKALEIGMIGLGAAAAIAGFRDGRRS